MLLMIDNYDSFTYNLVQYFGALQANPLVKRNDEISISEIEAMQPDYLVISPGPGWPQDAGISKLAIRHFSGKIPILGVCLGHQAIGEVYGASTTHAPQLMHGKTSTVMHDKKTIFRDLKTPFKVTRYHSLVINSETLSEDLEVSAWTEDNVIMAIRHKKYPLEGVQFHPEAILTEEGLSLLRNFLELYSRTAPRCCHGRQTNLDALF